MSRFLFISKYGDGLGLALRLQSEGHDVLWWATDELAAKSGKGMLPFFSEAAHTVGSETTVVFDTTGFGKLADMLRWQGMRVFAGSSLMDKLEEDRKYAFQVMKHCGIPIPQEMHFTDWEAAKDFCLKLGDRCVFKPSGELASHCSSFVSDDAKQMVSMLDYYASLGGEPDFELQEFIDGVDISTEGWFDGNDFVEPFNHTLETKKFMDGDIGKSEGCTGNIVWAVDDDVLVRRLLFPLRKFLRQNNYVGPIDVNAILTPEGDCYALEFTPRFGYDATPTLVLELFDGDFGAFLREPTEMPLSCGFASGIRISIPPWPNEDHKAEAGILIQGVDKNHFSPHDVYFEDTLKTSGAWGIIGVLTGYGDSVEEAFSGPYKLAKKLVLPQKQYRTDLAEYFKKKMSKVRGAIREAAA